MNPSGLRVGTPAMTTRGFTEADFHQVAVFLDQAVKIAQNVQAKLPGGAGAKLADFTRFIEEEQPPELILLKKEVADFCGRFETVGS
eukprot:g5449.t1